MGFLVSAPQIYIDIFTCDGGIIVEPDSSESCPPDVISSTMQRARCAAPAHLSLNQKKTMSLHVMVHRLTASPQNNADQQFLCGQICAMRLVL